MDTRKQIELTLSLIGEAKQASTSEQKGFLLNAAHVAIKDIAFTPENIEIIKEILKEHNPDNYTDEKIEKIISLLSFICDIFGN